MSHRVIVATLALLTASIGVSTVSAAETLLPAPHQLEAVTWEADHSADGMIGGAAHVVVALGSADDAPVPSRDELGAWTLLGTRGALPASLLDISKRCEFLCGDELESCHYVARLAPAGDLDSVGVPVAALPGSFELGTFEAVKGTAEQPAARRPAAASAFTAPIWPDGNPGQERARLLWRDGGFVYEYGWGNAGPFEMPAGECREGRRGPLTRVTCDALDALFDGETMLLAGVADYAGPVADVHASTEHGGRRYLLLQYSLKAQVVWGLLYRDETGRWRALIRPRDYALLC